MSYAITGLQLRKNVGGQTFKFFVPEENQHYQVELKPWLADDAWPQQGLEAYVIPGHCTIPGTPRFPIMLKVFRTEVPERDIRTRFLTRKLQLGSAAARTAHGLPDDLHWMFFGFPLLWLGRITVNGMELIAHMTRHIGGERPGSTADFRQWKQNPLTDPLNWDRVTPAERQELALQVVDMVRVLEDIGLVHGDLSHGNLLIGPGPDGKLHATLCDYDGYHAERVPQLPRRNEKEAIRPIGTPEYQHPDILERSLNDADGGDPGLYVGTDRFAMAVLICEIMSWSSTIKSTLTRENLLQEEIRARSLETLDARVPEARKAFPAGFALLDKALRTTGMWAGNDVAGWARDNLPGPDEWEACLRGPPEGDQVWPPGATPRINIFHQVGTLVPTRRSRIEIEAAHGNVRDGADLPAAIEYSWREAEGTLALTFPHDDEVRVRRKGDGRWRRLDRQRPLSVPALPGDEFVVDGWHLQVT